MQTLGLILKNARRRKKLSIKKLSVKTKIKENFLQALEQDRWDKLPNFAITAGFVKVISDVLGLSNQTTAAILRREFPVERPQQPNQPTSLWTPNRTMFLGIAIIVFVIALYLTKQYTTFVSSPPLEISLKRENNNVKIEGKTGKYATILINNEPTLVNNGLFSLSLTVQPGQVITIEAISRSGKSTKKELIAP